MASNSSTLADDSDSDDESYEPSSCESSETDSEIEDKSDSSGPDQGHEVDRGVPIFNPQEIKVIRKYIQPWRQGSVDHRQEIIQQVVKEIIALGGNKAIPDLERLVMKWFRRNVRKSKNIYPWKAPGVKTVISALYDTEIRARIAETHGDCQPGDPHWISYHSQAVAHVKSSLSSVEQEEVERKRQEWKVIGLPMELRQKYDTIISL